MIRAAAILCAAVCLLGFTECRRGHRQLASDLQAGASAYLSETDPVKKALIGKGLAHRINALFAAYTPLPAPAKTPAEIQADPSAYEQSGAKAEANPPKAEALSDEPPKQTPAEIIRGIGERVLSWGVWFALFGVIVLMLRWAPWFSIGAIARLTPIAATATIAAAGGSVSSIAGTAAIWLADYWVLVVAITVVSAIVAWIVYAKRARIVEAAKSAHRRMAGKVNQ